MIKVSDLVTPITSEITQMCCYFHENPELSMQEFNTCQILEDYVKKNVVYERLKRVGETGLFFEIKGTKSGPQHVIAFRGDIDALPIQEVPEAPLRSKIPGVMHACGHDIHGTINVGAAKLLSSLRDQFSGSIYFFIQPGEEKMLGAKLFVNDPDIDFSKIEGAVALHSMPDIDAGTIGVRYGAILSSADEIRIDVQGKGGHGAHPQTVQDPIVAAASIVLNLQTLIARETAPEDAAVVSICSIHGGNTHNTIPEKVSLIGTCRTINPKTRDRIEEGVKRIATCTAESLQTTACVEYIRGVPPLLCESDWVDRAIRAGKKVLGENAVHMLPHPSMGAEDFAFIKEKCPGVFIRLGCKTPGGKFAPMHASDFYNDPETIPSGMKVILGVALDFFNIDYEL